MTPAHIATALVCILLVAIPAALLMLAAWLRGQLWGSSTTRADRYERRLSCGCCVSQRASRQTLITGRRAVKVTRAAWKAAPDVEAPAEPHRWPGDVTAKGRTGESQCGTPSESTQHLGRST